MKSWKTPKDPDEVLDYEIDWRPRMKTTDSIISSTWTVPSGITMDSENFDDFFTVIWLSGGTLNTNYDFLSHVVTREGRTLEQSVRLKVKAR